MTNSVTIIDPTLGSRQVAMPLDGSQLTLGDALASIRWTGSDQTIFRRTSANNGPAEQIGRDAVLQNGDTVVATPQAKAGF